MQHVLLVIHLLIAAALVGIILIQRSEGGALGIGGGGGGGLVTGRSAGNILTRATGILAAAFFATSLILAIVANGSGKGSSIVDGVTATAPATADGAAAPATAPEVPAQPAAPSAPIAK